MPRPPSRHPTELELEILKALWNGGPATARQLQERLQPARELAYTTIMTMMAIMENKGYVERQRAGGGYEFTAAVDRQDASRGMLRDVVDRVYDGSVAAVVQQLLESSDLDAAELKKIRQILRRKSP